MSYLESLYTAFRTAISAVWTDVPANGIWETEHIEMIPWEDLTPPYAVILIGDTPVNDTYSPSDCETFAPMVHIYYIAAVSGGSSGIRAKLEALRDYLYANNLSAGQVIRVESLSWGNALPPNVPFSAKNQSNRAGRLVAFTVIGEVTRT